MTVERTDSTRAAPGVADGGQTLESLALAPWHRSHGAELVPHLGFELPSTYGDPDAELAALRQGLL